MIARERGLVLSGALTLIVIVAMAGSVAAKPSTISLLAPADSVPSGWLAAGSRPQDYVMVIDRSVTRSGRPSARIESKVPQPTGFGTLMQQFAADSYRESRVRLSGDVRVRDVTGAASLWMRVDGPGVEVLAFDNALDRGLRGTADWQRFNVVLDVPARAEKISIGVMLQNGGVVWTSALDFEKVARTVPVTGRDMNAGYRLPAAPVNLGFDAARP
jgi:hypothetical protein